MKNNSDFSSNLIGATIYGRTVYTGEVCVAGRFAALEGAASCEVCAAGRVSSSGATNCTPIVGLQIVAPATISKSSEDCGVCQNMRQKI